MKQVWSKNVNKCVTLLYKRFINASHVCKDVWHVLQHLLLITEPYFTDKLHITALIITNRFHNCTKPDDLIAISTPISINHAALISTINVHVKLSHFCLQVLEVSSPTAGSALIGPSQIQTLQAARELTVRTMSAFGESVDSLPVNVPAKLPAIMSGASLSRLPVCASHRQCPHGQCQPWSCCMCHISLCCQNAHSATHCYTGRTHHWSCLGESTSMHPMQPLVRHLRLLLPM